MAEDMNQGGAPQNNQYVAFNLRDEEYGVSILNVQEIRNLTDITRVPYSADFIKGVINLRGAVLRSLISNSALVSRRRRIPTARVLLRYLSRMCTSACSSMQ